MARRSQQYKRFPPEYTIIPNDRGEGRGDFLRLLIIAVGICLVVFVVVGLTVYFTFDVEGMKIFLYICGILSIFGFLVGTVKIGADIAIRSTETAATVFMKQDVVDAYTDRYRNGGGPTTGVDISQIPMMPMSGDLLPGRGQTDFANISIPTPTETLRL